MTEPYQHRWGRGEGRFEMGTQGLASKIAMPFRCIPTDTAFGEPETPASSEGLGDDLIDIRRQITFIENALQCGLHGLTMLVAELSPAG